MTQSIFFFNIQFFSQQERPGQPRLPNLKDKQRQLMREFRKQGREGRDILEALVILWRR